MSKPQIENESKDYIKSAHFLYEILNSLDNIEEVKNFMKDILTSSELKMIKRRWHIANLLDRGLNVREVAAETQTSSQTVSKIKRILEEGEGGFKLAIERVEKMIIKDNSRNKGSKKRGGSTFIKNWF